MKNLATITVILATLLFIGCKKKKSEPEPVVPTSQKCMDENGPAFFLNSAGQCEWSQALSLCNSGNHWNGGGWDVAEPGYSGFIKVDIEFFRDGSNTSGTGKTKCGQPFGCIGSWEGHFSWKKDPYSSKIIQITSSDSVFNKHSPFSSMSEIVPNTSNPTTFTANVTTPISTIKMTFIKASGAF